MDCARTGKWLPAVLLVIAVARPAAAGGPLQQKIPGLLIGCRGVLKTNVARVKFRHSLETMSDLQFEVPVGTWVEENGPIGHARPGETEGVRDAKFALLEGDRVVVRNAEMGRRTSTLTLALEGETPMSARIELRFSKSLKKNLSDIERFWSLLDRAVALQPDPEDPDRCGSPGS